MVANVIVMTITQLMYLVCSDQYEVDDSFDILIITVQHDVGNLSTLSYYVTPSITDSCIKYQDDIDLTKITDKKE